MRTPSAVRDIVMGPHAAAAARSATMDAHPTSLVRRRAMAEFLDNQSRRLSGFTGFLCFVQFLNACEIGDAVVSGFAVIGFLGMVACAFKLVLTQVMLVGVARPIAAVFLGIFVWEMIAAWSANRLDLRAFARVSGYMGIPEFTFLCFRRDRRLREMEPTLPFISAAVLVLAVLATMQGGREPETLWVILLGVVVVLASGTLMIDLNFRTRTRRVLHRGYAEFGSGLGIWASPAGFFHRIRRLPPSESLEGVPGFTDGARFDLIAGVLTDLSDDPGPA